MDTISPTLVEMVSSADTREHGERTVMSRRMIIFGLVTGCAALGGCGSDESGEMKPNTSAEATAAPPPAFKEARAPSRGRGRAQGNVDTSSRRERDARRTPGAAQD
jgi:hypothetical protein